MLKETKTLICLLFLINLCLADRIIPDPNFPVLLTPNKFNKLDSSTLELRFKLPTKYSEDGKTSAGGLYFNQFFGVRFQNSVFSFTSNRPTCSLSTATVPVISVTSIQSENTGFNTSTVDSNIIYCQLNDKTTPNLVAGETIILKLTFVTAITTKYINDIHLFTTTSNKLDGLLIDNTPGFGSIGLYNDFTTVVNRQLVVFEKPSDNINITGGGTILYPFSTFDMKIAFIVNNQAYKLILHPNDYTFVLLFNTVNFSNPTSITTSEYGNVLPLDANASSNLTYTELSGQGIILNGLTVKELVLNRRFYISLNGMKASDKNLAVMTHLTLVAYYKNTYNIVSWYRESLRRVEPASITNLNAYHPEKMYMFDGWAWPFVFEFSLGSDLSNGGYVVLRNSNYDVKARSVSLVASSCDFSDNTVDQDFGKRSTCFPLRNDFNWTGDVSSLESSGVFFKMSLLSKNVVYKIKIWGFIDICKGEDTTMNLAQNLFFSINIYYTAAVNNTYLNETRFPSATTSTNWKIAVTENSQKFIIERSCWPLQSRTDYIATGGNDDLRLDLNKTTGSAIVANNVRRAWGLEITNLGLLKEASDQNMALYGTTSSTYLLNTYDLDGLTATTSTIYLQKYLYDTSATDLPNSNLFFYGVFQGTNLAGTTVAIHNYYPTECFGTSTGQFHTTISNQRIQFLFSKQFLVESINLATGCTVGWKTPNSTNAGGTVGQRSVLTLKNTLSNINIASITSTNQIRTLMTSVDISITSSAGYKVIQDKNIITTNSDLTSISSSNTMAYRIASQVQTFGSTINSLSMIGVGTDCDATVEQLALRNANTAINSYIMAVYTNCLKWDSIPSNVKSLNTYFEVQKVLLQDNKYPLKVVRFIKLFPELGVFQSPVNTEKTEDLRLTEENEKWIQAHYTVTDKNTAPFAVCLIEISGYLLDKKKGTSSNMLIIWLLNTSLLDLDPTSFVNEYPVAPSTSGVSYGVNSGQTISLGNRLIGDPNGTTDGINIYPVLSGSIATTESGLSLFEYNYYKNIARAIYGTAAFPISRPTNFEFRRTFYYAYMSSIIFIKTSQNPTGSQESNLLIPFLCPNAVDYTDSATTYSSNNNIYFTAPIVSVAWAQMDKYNSVSKIDSYLNGFQNVANTATKYGGDLELFSDITGFNVYVSGVNSIAYQPIHVILLKPNHTGAASTMLASNTKTSGVDRAANIYHLRNYFVKYTSTNTNDIKSYTFKNTSGVDGKFSAIAIFAGSSIGALDTTISSNINNTTAANNKIKSKTMLDNNFVYILGKKFNKFIGFTFNKIPAVTTNVGTITAFLRGDAMTSKSFDLASNLSYTITGIPRIGIEKYNSKTSIIDPLNHIAIFTSLNSESTATMVTRVYTNLSINSTLFYDFVLYYPDVDNVAWTGGILKDTEYTDLDVNNAANFKVTGTIPSSVPSGSQLVLTMGSGVLSSTTNNTVCGLVESGVTKMPTLCSVLSNSITCNFTAQTTTFYVCCYNSIDNGASTINVSSGTLNLPYNTSYITSNVITGLNTTFDNTLYKFPVASTSNIYQLTLTRTNIKSVSNSTFFAKVTDMRYSISSTHNGLGLVTLTIDLGQSAQRGMTITVNSNFSLMRIPNVRTRIVPTFSSSNLYGSNFENGDIFIESIYSTLADNSPIQLRLKNILYKCGLSLSSSLKINMWPVRTVNYLTHTITSVNVKSVDGTSMSADTTHTLSSSPALNTDIATSNIQDNVMAIEKIDPLVIGETATYSFKFNLNTIGSTIENKIVNEVLIFLPYMNYGQNSPVDCYGEDFTKLECQYIINSGLSIKLANNISINTDTLIIIQISGLRNPNLSEALYWVASLNNTDFYENKRSCILVATTSLNDGIQVVSDSTYGQIVFKNQINRHSFTILSSNTNQDNLSLEVGNVQHLNPRESPELIRQEYRSFHQFSFSLDVANETLFIDNNYLFNDSPILYVTFPNNYKFYWYNFTPIANFEIIDYSEGDMMVEVAKRFSVKSILVLGNKIKIEFDDLSFELTKKFQYFILSLYNIPPPVETTVQGEIVTTEGFEMLLTSKDYKKVFKIYTNTNNFSNGDVLGTKVNTLVDKNKGLKYEYDSFKYIIDAVDKSGAIQKLNTVTVFGGRFIKYFLKIRSTQKLLVPAKTDISINNSSIFFDRPFYTVSSLLNSEVEFLVGISCSSQSGWEVVNPTYINSSSFNVYESFLPLSPWVVSIVSNGNNYGVISFVETNIVREVGSLFIDFWVDFPPFEDLTINFSGSEFAKILPTVISSGSYDTRTTFLIIKQGGLGDPSFELSNPSSKCFKYKYNKINFKVDGVSAIIPNSAMKREEFQYKNSNDDSSISKNSVKFIFNTLYTQIYLYAVLVCFKDDFPSDENMKNQNVTESNKLSYFSEILNIEGKAELIFNNLIRGQAYKLKVIIESTQGDKTFRTSSKIEIWNQSLTNGTVIDIKAADSKSPLCASYRFNTRPGRQLTDRLLWYWQGRYSQTGYYEGGCISAVDQYGTMIPGLPDIKNELDCGRSNCRFIDRKLHIHNETNLSESETYTICAYPLSNCTNDPSNFEETYNNIVTELNLNTTFVEKLNVEVSPEFELTQVKDNTVPEIGIASDVKYSNNKVTFSLSSNLPYICYVIPSKTSPASSSFDLCKSNCSPISTSKKLENFSVDFNTSETGTFTLFSVCYNNMPCSKLRSRVFELGSFTTSGSSNNNNNNNNNSNGNNSGNSGNSSESSSTTINNSDSNSSYLISAIFALLCSVLILL